SASTRFVVDYVAGFCLAASRMASVVRSLVVDRRRMAQNLEQAGDLLVSEAVYVLTALGGDPEAHERVRQATLQAEKQRLPLAGILRGDTRLWGLLDRQLRPRGTDAETFFATPGNYRGKASERAHAIADEHERAAQEIREAIGG
ncbi:MAG TPA: adenylosuccinate lyase, partial [Spirochaetia bacterium]|nr:adenylosuccinate lyase [Spirochaetia bacterium]